MTSEKPGSRSSGAAPPATATIQVPASQIGAPAIASRQTRPWSWMATTVALLVALAAVLPTSSLVRRRCAGGIAGQLRAGHRRAARRTVRGRSEQRQRHAVARRHAHRVRRLDGQGRHDLDQVARGRRRASRCPGRRMHPIRSGRRMDDSIGFFANGKVWAVKIAGGLPEAIAALPTAAAAARGARTARSSLPLADPPCHVCPLPAARSARSPNSMCRAVRTRTTGRCSCLAASVSSTL